MRLDKYLKISRLIKRRTVANEACDAGRVLVNGNPARASYGVKVGDVLELHLGERVLRAQVVSVAEYAKKEEAGDLYRYLCPGVSRIYIPQWKGMSPWRNRP